MTYIYIYDFMDIQIVEIGVLLVKGHVAIPRSIAMDG